MRLGRTLPPAVAPIGLKNIANGFRAMFQGGTAQRNFTRQLKEYFNVRHCFLLSSGKASLTLILQALKKLHPEKDEVLIPAFTCYSVPAAIVRAGLKIRICDINCETLDFDYDELSVHFSSPGLLCIIPTHLFGVTADIPRVREIIGYRDITIIEDAAQVMGGECRGRKAGTLGDVGFFSLERGKSLSTVEGGVILTNSEDIAHVLYRQIDALPEYSRIAQLVLAMYALVLSVFSRPSLFWIPKSLPFLGLGETVYAPGFSIKRMSSFQAGLAQGWIKRLGEFIEIRFKNAEYFLKSGVKPTGEQLLSSGFIRYPVIVSNRGNKNAILATSSRLGLGIADVYPGTVEGIDELNSFIVSRNSIKAQTIVERMITLPVHPYVTEEDMENIAELIREPEGKFGE
jgi:perosamine synthetase